VVKPIPGFTDKSLPVPILQGEPEFARLVELYQSLCPTAALEIGSLFGGTLYYWITRAPSGAVVVSVDMNVDPRDSRYGPQVHGREHLWPEWARGADVTLHTLVGPSNTFKATVRDLVPAGLDFVFIDANHTYTWARSDFETYWDLIKPGGIVAFHDIYRRTEIDEVWRLWAEICGAGHDCEEFSSIPEQDDWGIGVVRKTRNVELAVVTAVSRPWYLDTILPHVAEGANLPGLTLTWYIIHDAESVPEPRVHRPCWVVEDAFHSCGAMGYGQVNFAIRKYLAGRDTLVWVLDDDNLPHPDFFLAIRNAAACHPQAHGFAFAQEVRPGAVRRVSPDSMRVCHIDQAQYVWRERYRGDVFFTEAYTGDGLFLEALYTKNPAQWILVDEVLSYYNRLRPS
jgi:hypothetical protein